MIPGNHDAYVEVKWREAWAHWSDYHVRRRRRQRPDARATPSHSCADAATVALIGIVHRSRDATDLRHRQARRAASCAALERLLDGLSPKDLCRVLLLHHPPVATMTDYRRRLVDGDAPGRVPCEQRPVDACPVRPPAHLPAGRHALPTAPPIPVVGAPSASLHGGDRHHEGGYIIYDLEHEP